MSVDDGAQAEAPPTVPPGPALPRPPLRFDAQYRCVALSQRSGERCRRAAIKGGSVCAFHGGSAPQVKAKAAERLAERERAALRKRALRGTGSLLDELEVEAGERHPVDVLIEAVGRASAMAQLYGLLVGELSAPMPDAGFPSDAESLWGSNHLGDGARHVLVEEYERWIELSARCAKWALDAGVDERRVRIVENQAATMAQVLKATVGALVVALREQGVRIGSPQLAAVMEQVPAILGGELRRAGAVAVGEVEAS